MPSQPRDLRVNEIGETSIGLQWAKPNQVGEQILSYELYWNDTYAKVDTTIITYIFIYSSYNFLINSFTNFFNYK